MQAPLNFLRTWRRRISAGLVASLLLVQGAGIAHACDDLAAAKPVSMPCHEAARMADGHDEAPVQTSLGASLCKAHCDTANSVEQRQPDLGAVLGMALAYAPVLWQVQASAAPVTLSLSAQRPPAVAPPPSILLGNFRS